MKYKLITLCKVTALTKHDKAFYYADAKRISKAEYNHLSDTACRVDCLHTIIKGDKVKQYKNVYNYL